MTQTKKVRLDTTREGHMPSPNEIRDARVAKDRLTYEVAPAGNGVIIEEQMVKANQTMMDYNLMTGLMTKQMGMYRTALGRQQ